MKVSETYIREDRTGCAPPRRHPFRTYETLTIVRVFVVIASVLVGVWVISAVMLGYFALLKHILAVESPPALPISAHGNPLPPEPRLQRSPADDLNAMRIATEWQLNHYSWVDKQRGIVSLPIERAMQIIAERGIPPQKVSGAPSTGSATGWNTRDRV